MKKILLPIVLYTIINIILNVVYRARSLAGQGVYRARSLAGQGVGLLIRRSRVQIPAGPLYYYFLLFFIITKEDYLRYLK